MIIVHHLNNSRSQRVLWLLEELAVDYDVKRYQRDPKTMLAPAELRQVHRSENLRSSRMAPSRSRNPARSSSISPTGTATVGSHRLRALRDGCVTATGSTLPK